MFDSVALRARLVNVRERIARAAGRAGRDPAAIQLVAVSKTFSPDHIRAATDNGQVDFGENKVQEALGKMEALADLPIRWHLLGHLQSNKARKAAAFHVFHGLDSVALLEKLDAAATALDRHPLVLVQVDLAGEASKFGAEPAVLRQIFAKAADCRGVTLGGLMLLPPAVDDANDARPYFRQLREIRDALRSDGVPAPLLDHLSMGMSHDFEVAIEEGATIIRVGSAIFGERGPI